MARSWTPNDLLYSTYAYLNKIVKTYESKKEIVLNNMLTNSKQSF